MAPSPGFSLSKWYFDCVTDEGDAFVGYAASLRWSVLSLEYSGILVRRTTGKIQTRSTLHGGKLPLVSGSAVQWDCPSLKLKGSWSAREQPLKHTVLSASETPLEWSCLQPHALAEISVADIGTFTGSGYVDYLTLTTPPWRLPLDELRWGRFLSESTSVIWMDFKGACPETVVFCNGTLCDGARVTDSEIDLGKDLSKLSFEDSHILREGVLGLTALSVIPGVTKLLPARMLKAEECKWRSRGVLKDEKSVLATGWTIHEVVRWPQSDTTERL
jgi:hypothetical protein